jgi:glyoxylase-like metal-dependent hydrolase (beta-lactamase superfamily II)
MERIPLSNDALEGNNNVYLMTDESGTVLVDTGDPTASTRTRLEAAMRENGLELVDVDHLLLTHWHPDHTGLAGEIQAASDATVYCHTADAPLIEGHEDAWREMYDRQERCFERWGMPEGKRDVLREMQTVPGTTGETPDVTTVEDGTVLSFGDLRLEVVHAPGHSAGQCAFRTAIDGEQVIVSGDALLPVYTPNVGGADVRVADPLAKYLRTLQDIVDTGYDRALPGHRDPIDDPAERAMEIIVHHEERARRVLEALARRGPCDAWTVSEELFGDLEGVHVMHGPGEAYAHLDHLTSTGTVVREGRNYRLGGGIAAELDASQGDRWSLAR